MKINRTDLFPYAAIETSHDIVTDWFQPAASAYQRLACNEWARRWWWAILLPVAICCLFAVSDLRFAFVALILLFMVVPFVVFNIHFYTLLSPELRSRLHRQRLVISYGKFIHIEYEAPPFEEGSEMSDLEKPPTLKAPDDESVDWSAVERIERRGKEWLIRLTKNSGHTPRFLLAPCDAVGSDITYPLYYE